MDNNEETPVANPTYMADIRHFFEEIDIQHMRPKGIELATYEAVKENALRIFFTTRPPNASMPPEPERKWSQARSETFYNWMRNGYIRGVVEPQPIIEPLRLAADGLRVRRSITEVLENVEEFEKLKRAFRGLMALDADFGNPNSYFNLAGIHWLPPPTYCLHHENRYNPWHRAYLLVFENALRSVEGCEDVTLPYWDIRTRIPDALYEEPFRSYKLPREICNSVGNCYPLGYETQRFSADDIFDNVHNFYRIPETIADALSQSHWERFNGWNSGISQSGIILAHDNGHVACGPTLGNQDVAAFDPLFWFFHANWDRLWWKWQQTFDATTLNTFKSHLLGSADWLDDPILNVLPPFTKTSADTINLAADGISYTHPADEIFDNLLPPRFGSIMANVPTGIKATNIVSVRVKNVDRLQIPGSFNVSLFAGDKRLATQGFFQSTTPKQCENCRKRALVSFDFLVNQEEILENELKVRIHLLREDEAGGAFPLSAAGNPTLNVRLLLESQQL